MTLQEAIKLFGFYSEIKQEDIKSKYRQLAKENHPDIGGDEDLFKRINEAYNLLKETQLISINESINGVLQFNSNSNNGYSFNNSFGGFGNSVFRSKTIDDLRWELEILKMQAEFRNRMMNTQCEIVRDVPNMKFNQPINMGNMYTIPECFNAFSKTEYQEVQKEEPAKETITFYEGNWFQQLFCKHDYRYMPPCYALPNDTGFYKCTKCGKVKYRW